jgi:predicted NodU family carbamoyl transferase
MCAFAPSGFDQAAVLVIDSLGETCTTSISSASTLAAGNVWYRIIETMKWMRFIAVFCGKRQSRPRR